MRKFLWQRTNLKKLINIKEGGYKFDEEYCENGNETEYEDKGYQEDAENEDQFKNYDKNP